MSTDEAVTNDLLQTLEDGREGYTKGAEKLGQLDQPALVTTFTELAAQRQTFADELQGMANDYGDDPDRSGSVAAALHRGWMSLTDALTKDTPKAVLEAARQGDDHAVNEYEKALGNDDVSADLRTVVERQLAGIRTARDTINGLASSAD
jgi:uncharacterized protein (TIGR02284 family)